MDNAKHFSPAMTVSLFAIIGAGIGTSLGVTQGNLMAWIALCSGVGGAIGGGLLIKRVRHRLVFILMLIVASAALAVTVTHADSGRVIHVKLYLDDGAEFSQDWPVYVYASAPGSKLPLSSTRLKLSELPTTVVLTEAMYVLPALTMKDHQKLIVTAKVSSHEDVHKTGAEDSYSQSPVLQFDGPSRRVVELVVTAAE